MNQSQPLPRFPKTRVLVRHFLGWALTPLFPIRLSDPENSIQQANTLNEDGIGLLIIINHFSLRDSLQTMLLICRSPSLRRRWLLAPVAYHQVLKFGWFGRFLGWLFGVKVLPVVTPDTIRVLKKRPTDGSGLKEYFEAAGAAFDNGQIVLLAPQGGRRSSLGIPRGRPVAALVSALCEKQIDRFALLFVGLGLTDSDNYSRELVGGLNFGRLYQLQLGKIVPAADLESSVPAGVPLDEWVFNQLADLTPVSYSGKPKGNEKG